MMDLVGQVPEHSELSIGNVSTSSARATPHVDPNSLVRLNKLVRTIPVGGRTKTPCGIAATRDAVWVAIGDSFCDTIGQ